MRLLCSSPLVEPAVRISRNGLHRLHSLEGGHAFLVILSSSVDILVLPLSAGNVSPNRQLNLSRLLPMYPAFPRSEYYKRAPTSTVASVSLRFGHSIDILSPLHPNQTAVDLQVP